ncbi:hypothetical protein GJ744_007108 [Endocarpon pusillum]|uniref:DUF6604 domain-containing protein n=1 Tax=Endocarpon pusillum TaxID=364733 RepID=A0A8H7A3T8_9EURO|nr:hypothetical protein GJ744_007108 [Endocarpon pusillum]
MLPNFLSPSYKQYKADSDAVATWLATTAQQCGYPKDLLTNQAASQQKAPKLKGRARKLARDAAQNQSSDSQGDKLKSEATPGGSKYLIAINNFIPLAEWIVKTRKPRVEAPAGFVSVLDRAISVRKRHHTWWQNQSEKTDGNTMEEKNANESHGYFIGVLEKVREVLRPRMPPELLSDPLPQPAEKAAASKDDAHCNMANLFNNLNIEEPSDAFLNAEPATSQSTIRTPQVKYGINHATDLEEVYLAVYCLFNDLNNIRQCLQKVWEGYRQGAFDLVAASITTNTAIDFARGIQEDFTETFPQNADFERHINVLYASLCSASGYEPDFKERPDDEMNFAVYEDAESVLFPTYMLISSFNDVVVPGSLPAYKPGHYGAYSAQSDRMSKSSRDKFREDKVVLLEILPEFCVLALAPNGAPAEDEMTRGMREMVKHKKIPLWLTFAAQIFLDIHHTLREKVGDGLFDLVKSARYVENSITQVLKFHENLRIENWPRSNDQGLLQILELITNWVKTDPVEAARRRLIKGPRLQLPPTEPFLLLKHHPIYCGLLSYSIKALTQEASIIFVNAWGSVLYSAHLYNALRQEKLISTPWQDMDLALLMHRIEDMFIGDFPKAIDDYFKRFSLAMGYSASMFAKNRRKAGVIASKAGPRGLNNISPISEMFKARYCGNDGRTNLSLDDVYIILKKRADDDDDDDIHSEESTEWKSPRIQTKMPEQSLPVPPTKKFQPSKSQNHQRKTSVSATTGVRPVQLLNALLNAIQTEMLELSFDHFCLHTFSWRLLRRVQQTLDQDLRDIYGPGYLEKESQLPFVVGYIFMAAVRTTKLAGVLVPKKKDVVTSRLLVKAAEAVREMLESGAGRIELMKLKGYFGYEIEMPDLWEVAEPMESTSTLSP